MNKLVIVESPAKARTIGKMLGSQYAIKASMGHVRDLPTRTFGVDIEHDFMPQYEETKERSKNLTELKSAAKKATDIYLAPDPDRERRRSDRLASAGDPFQMQPECCVPPGHLP